jgi:uncharacterized RDD family membrane protein YckC
VDEGSKKLWPGFWQRLGALLIDSLILGVIGFAAGSLAFEPLAAMGDLGRLIGLATVVLYFGVLASGLGGGATPGHRLLKLRVTDRQGRPLGLPTALLRALILGGPWMANGLFVNLPASPLSSLVGVTLCMVVFGGTFAQVYLYLFNRPSRRLLHDLLTGAYVVRATASPSSGQIPRVHLVICGFVFVAAGLAAQFLPGACSAWRQRPSLR